MHILEFVAVLGVLGCVSVHGQTPFPTPPPTVGIPDTTTPLATPAPTPGIPDTTTPLATPAPTPGIPDTTTPLATPAPTPGIPDTTTELPGSPTGTPPDSTPSEGGSGACPGIRDCIDKINCTHPGPQNWRFFKCMRKALKDSEPLPPGCEESACGCDEEEMDEGGCGFGKWGHGKGKGRRGWGGKGKGMDFMRPLGGWGGHDNGKHGGNSFGHKGGKNGGDKGDKRRNKSRSNSGGNRDKSGRGSRDRDSSSGSGSSEEGFGVRNVWRHLRGCSELLGDLQFCHLAKVDECLRANEGELPEGCAPPQCNSETAKAIETCKAESAKPAKDEKRKGKSSKKPGNKHGNH